MGSILYLFISMCFLLLLSASHLIVTNSSSSMQQSLCHDSESSALLQFKQSFLIDEYASYDPSAYPKVAVWKSHGEGEGNDCCSWDGVECDMDTGHVIGLHLASSCLSGSINSSSTLFNLVHLQRLDLSDNHFNYSEIPNGIGQLLRLRSLDLSYSHFSGQIPSELLALSKLVFLDLSGNPMLQLQKLGLRNLVQNLTHLKKLRLSQVNISSTIPHALANLSSLRSLLLGECGLLGGFPMIIFRLPSLQFLSVTGNPALTGYLPEFQETSPLKMLYLGNTSFSGELPASIGRLGSLTELDISLCNFTGLVPSSFGHLPQLSYLDLSNNHFRGQISSFLGNLTHLSYLDLSNNHFSGQIPSFMENLTQLISLDLSVNDFSVGSLAWLGQQTNLTTLYLGQINLNGEIPSSLVNMSELTVLSLTENQLIGQIPSWLMNLTQLTVLDLGTNNLEGPIPSSLFELVHLQYLSLVSNNLTGTVELPMLSKLKNLTYFQLSHNRLSLLSHTSTNATLPKFKFLGLASCNLTEFPDFMWNQDELEVLFLGGNKIHGPIPKWLWTMSKETLEVLILARNILTGFDQLPAVLPWSKMRMLDLRSNMLQGSLPVPPPSTYLYSVSGNKLTGEIPPLICDLTSLKLLVLSDNNFSGRIPQCLTSLSSSLFVLDLRGNNLHGAIPQICTNTSNLRVIDLSDNQFRGHIPRSLTNCMMLEHLVLGNNQIHNIFPFWLGALPQLHVLILKSNRFHGAIGIWHTNFRFPKLHIIDLSYNDFTGNLPSEYLKNWDSMKLADANHFKCMQAKPMFEMSGYTMISHYMCSMTMTNKGMQRFYEKIPGIFIVIDFSGNNFEGQIPTSIGSLKGLHLLNLGGNNLTGHIPSSLGNLTQLESLDLSQNKLSGEIPWQLTRITFLEFFNVSHNHLTGPIPQGNQFDTFQNESYQGNPGLCGGPLSKKCSISEGSPLPPSTSRKVEDSKLGINAELMMVLMGYGSGLVVGVVIGHTLTTRKHEWFVEKLGKRQRRGNKRRRGN